MISLLLQMTAWSACTSRTFDARSGAVNCSTSSNQSSSCCSEYYRYNCLLCITWFTSATKMRSMNWTKIFPFRIFFDESNSHRPFKRSLMLPNPFSMMSLDRKIWRNCEAVIFSFVSCVRYRQNSLVCLTASSFGVTWWPRFGVAFTSKNFA